MYSKLTLNYINYKKLLYTILYTILYYCKKKKKIPGVALVLNRPSYGTACIFMIRERKELYFVYGCVDWFLSIVYSEPTRMSTKIVNIYYNNIRLVVIYPIYIYIYILIKASFP